MTREFDKLVRDKIPTIIEEDGEEPITYTADNEEYSVRLVEKLEEEVAEYEASGDLDELVDILEVVHAIRKDRGLSVEELQERRARKAERRGKFDDRTVLERVEE